ncbi:MAG: chromosomal replication initiator protein DnaA [Candidatus Pacebacteria bacterium]|nr:chromosomal replication initiator protein DnaA [Candidatus Paceibacterota bacterium]
MSELLDTRKVWENALVDIELTVSRANFSTWFKGTHVIRIDDGTVYVGVPSQFYKDWLADKHHKTILRALRGVVPDVRAIEYVIAREDRVKPSKERNLERSAPVAELPLAEHYVNRSDNLNPRYTFDTLVVGPFNELAHAASQAVVAEPGIAYNPLFIYGTTGCGKTHLMQAIGNQLKKQGGQRKIYYTTSERYGGDIVTALQQNTIQNVKDKYRSYDVLILDDVQFLSGKDKLQEELFHIFNTLYENNKQIIFSSDRHPSHITDLADRLKSRFSQGMIIDVSTPDHESRVAILKTKAAHNDFLLSDVLAQAIASEVEGNVRDLEGVLNRVMCETHVKGRQLDISDIRQIVKNNLRPQKNISIKELVERVARYYDIDDATIYEKTRKKEVVRPRQIIMYIMREDFSISYPTIGNKLGGRDHTTVIHSCDKIKLEIQTEPSLRREIEEIRAMLK